MTYHLNEDEEIIKEEEKEEEILEPLEVKIIKEKQEEKNPTSEDTQDWYDRVVTEEELKEMQDAQ